MQQFTRYDFDDEHEVPPWVTDPDVILWYETIGIPRYDGAKYLSDGCWIYPNGVIIDEKD